jgi:Domain of unknown function (DUF4349)
MAIIGSAVLGSAALAGCSGSTASSSAPEGAPQAAAPSAAAANGAAAAGAGDQRSGASSAGAAGGGQPRSASAARLIPASQQIIYTAQLSVRSKDVGSAIASATRIVMAAGGYVSSESATSDPDHPSSATATIELKIPVAAYQQTLASLAGGSLGTQLSLRQQAQDVTQQVADVSSQVTSDLAAIAQLRELLKHAGSVGELLDVQNQINQQEAALEGMQAQQRALNHETAFATLTLSVLGPKAAAKPATPAPPPGLANGLSGGWHAFKVTIDWLLAILGAVAPFAAALAIVAFAAWRLRRRVARPAVRPAPEPEPPAGA